MPDEEQRKPTDLHYVNYKTWISLNGDTTCNDLGMYRSYRKMNEYNIELVPAIESFCCAQEGKLQNGSSSSESTSPSLSIHKKCSNI